MMKNKKVYATAIWISILALVTLSFIGFRFTNNIVYARHLEDKGNQEASLSLYEHILSSEAKTLNDSVALISQSY